MATRWEHARARRSVTTRAAYDIPASEGDGCRVESWPRLKPLRWLGFPSAAGRLWQRGRRDAAAATWARVVASNGHVHVPREWGAVAANRLIGCWMDGPPRAALPQPRGPPAQLGPTLTGAHGRSVIGCQVSSTPALSSTPDPIPDLLRARIAAVFLSPVRVVWARSRSRKATAAAEDGTTVRERDRGSAARLRLWPKRSARGRSAWDSLVALDLSLALARSARNKIPRPRRITEDLEKRGPPHLTRVASLHQSREIIRNSASRLPGPAVNSATLQSEIISTRSSKLRDTRNQCDQIATESRSMY
nr:unnamed protein product [Digitaria exilis]